MSGSRAKAQITFDTAKQGLPLMEIVACARADLAQGVHELGFQAVVDDNNENLTLGQ